MAFSATESAFEGFRVIKRNPLVIAWWSLAYLVFFALLIAAIGGPFMALMPQLQAMEDQNPASMDFGPILQLYGLIFAVALPLGIAFSAILYAAVVRSVMSPEARAFGFMRLGKDELRLAGVSLILGLLFMLIYATLAAAIMILAVGAYSVNPGLGILLGFVTGLGALALLSFLAVRLSLAAPIVIAEKRFAVFDSWTLTKGYFWPLLGMSLIAFVMAIIVNILGAIVGMPFQFMGGTDLSTAIESGDTAAALAAVGPMVIIGLIVNLIVSTLQLVVLYAPFSAAYRDIMQARGAATTVPTTA